MTNREIDTLVAEHIFEYKLKREDCNSYWVDSEGVEPCHGHDYSSEIQDAWEIVEKMEEKDFNFLINNCVDPDSRYNTGYDVIFTDEDKNTYGITEDTAPMAIALAALKALGVKYE